MSFGTLVVSYPDGNEETVELLKPTVDVGSAADNDIVLRDPAVDPYHAQLLCDSSGCQVLDLGSATGTTLGGVDLTPQTPETLVDYATIQIGGVRMRYRTPVTAPAAPFAVEAAPRRSPLPALLVTAAIVLLVLLAGGLFLSGWLSAGDPAVTLATSVAETSTPVQLPTVTQPAREERTAEAETAPVATAPPSTSAIQNYVVSTSGGLRLNVRSAPGPDAPVVGQLENGTAVRGVEGPVTAGGVEWVRIEAGGLSGWSVREALLPQ